MFRGTLVAIAIRPTSRAPMSELSQAEVTRQGGVTGDFRGQRGPRQVTVVSQEAWQAACNDHGKVLPWTTRRGNLLVTGLDLAQTVDCTLSIGDVVLRITGETDPCERMEEASRGLIEALTPDWRGGVCCEVITGGVIQCGADVLLHDRGSASA